MHYQQTFGTAMGSPVSVTVANLVMEEIEEVALSSYPGTPPRFWKRYVDDTCTAVPIESLASLHEHLNSINEHIQFTVEKEENGCLPFLDSLLTHESDGSISTSVYRKKTHTDQYLQFSSHHPLAHKKSVITTRFHRATALSSNMVERVKENCRVTRALKNNGYPSSFIHQSSRSTPPPTSLDRTGMKTGSYHLNHEQPSHSHIYKASPSLSRDY